MIRVKSGRRLQTFLRHIEYVLVCRRVVLERAERNSEQLFPQAEKATERYDSICDPPGIRVDNDFLNVSEAFVLRIDHIRADDARRLEGRTCESVKLSHGLSPAA